MFRQVAHPLEVGRDMQSREQQPEVGRDRGLAGQQPVHTILDPGVMLVDHRVAGDHLLGEVAIGAKKRRGCLAHGVPD
jgi:hypothetical protein